MKTFLRTEFNYDTNEASIESGIECKDESKTKQSFKEESDINTIVKRFGLTGQLPEGVKAPTYGDFTEVMDFHTAMNAVAAAGEAFDRMPAEIRARFNNDPGAFVDFCSNDENRAEAEKMGLVVPKEVTKEGKVSPRPVTTSNELVGSGDSTPKTTSKPAQEAQETIDKQR